MGVWVIERKPFGTFRVRVREEKHWNGGKPWEKGFGKDQASAEKLASEIRALIAGQEAGQGDAILAPARARRPCEHRRPARTNRGRPGSG